MNSKKTDIIEAAMRLFVNEGFDRPSMEALAEEAQVSKRTLYKYFSNKKEILNDVILYLIDKKQSALSFKYDPEKPIDEQLKYVIHQKVNFLLCSHNIILTKVIFCELLKEDGALEGKVEDFIKSETTTLNWFKEAQKYNQFSSHAKPFDLIETLSELISGIVLIPILFERKKKFSKNDSDKILKMFLALYKA